MKETDFLYFHISLFACFTTRVRLHRMKIRCRRTRVIEMQTTRYAENTGSRSLSFLLYWLRQERIVAAFIITVE